MSLISEVAENVSKGHLYTTPVYLWNLEETTASLTYNPLCLALVPCTPHGFQL